MDAIPLNIPEVAKSIGVTAEMVRRYREGIAMPRRETMARLAALLGVSPAQLYAAESGDKAPVQLPKSAIIIDDAEELQLIEAYRDLNDTARKVVRARATELREQFARPSPRNPFGKGVS